MDNKEKFIAYSTFRMVCTFVGVMMINPDILSTKAFGLVLSISVVGEMILSLVKKEQFQKEEFSPKIKITAGIMIVLLLVHLIF